jgi:phosphoserine aminotransferase
MAIVIVRDDLIGQADPRTPAIFDYKVQAEADSMHNTPPSYAIYLAGLVFQWLKKLGGLAKMEELNVAKAKILYDYLDQTEFYRSPVAREDRSRMNVPFTLKSDKLDEEFLKQAQARGLAELKGHRAVGGMRASIYNAMPVEGVQSLVEFMREFEKAKG